MAAIETPVVAAPKEVSSETVAREERLAKVEKPDDDKFKKELAEAEKQLSAVTEKLVCQDRENVVN
jgi:hypothetical protein